MLNFQYDLGIKYPDYQKMGILCVTMYIKYI